LLARQVPDIDYPPPPYVVGFVDEVGPDAATECAVGDRVCAITATGLGGYAEYAVVRAESVVRSPSNSDHVAACTLSMNGLTARLAVDQLNLPAGPTVAMSGAAGTLGGYVGELARADGLRVVADASAADEALVRDLGADEVVRRGDEVARPIREICPDGVDGLVDCAVQDDLVVDALRDGGAIATVRFHTGSSERGITFVGAHITDHDRLDRLRRQVEADTLTLRVAETFPAERADDAHRRMEAGGVRGRLVLTLYPTTGEDITP
jgi:NADPH:quinone reductase-like Zn-dependent oxidoreductase